MNGIENLRLHKNIIMLFIVQLIEQTAMIAMRTVITPYAKAELMMSATLLGVLTGALSIASMASRLSAGGLMRKLSYLKLIRIALCVELIAYCLYIPARQFGFLMAVRLISGFFSGIAGTAIIALAGTMFTPERMGFGLGVFGFSQMAALGVGPAVSMVIYNHFGSRKFFIIEIVLELLALVMTVFVREAAGEQQTSAAKGTTASDPGKNRSGYNPEKVRKSWKEWVRTFILPSAVFPSSMNFFLQVAYASVSTFIIIYGQEKGWPNAGLYYTVYAIGSLAVRPLIGMLLDKKGLTLPVSICWSAFAASMVILATANSFPVFLFAACLMTIGFGGGWSVCQASALKCKDVRDKGAASATYFLINDFGMLVGAALAGACAEAYGYSRTFLIFIIPIAVGWVIYHVVLVMRKSGR